MSNKTALVLRATGSQGKGVTKHLLQAGWTVHALVTDPENPRAVALKNQGAVLFKGALNDPSSIEAAIKGAGFLFLNQMPSFVDDSETKDAASILSIAKAAGVQHVVHSTVLTLNDPVVRDKMAKSPLGPAVVGKADVGNLVRESGLPWTEIRGGYFMTNFLLPFSSITFPELCTKRLVSSYDPDQLLPLIDPDDIGAFTAAAFQGPPKFTGQVINLACEKLGLVDIGAEMSRVSRHKVEVVFRTPEETAELSKTNLLVMSQTLTPDLDKRVDIGDLKKWDIPLTSWRQFLEKRKDDLQEALVSNAGSESFASALKTITK